MGVRSSAGGSLPFCPLAPVSLVAVSQLGLTRRRRMRPKPFGAISCIPDGASPAPTLASTSLPRHCTGNAASSVRYSRHNACRARLAHLPIAHVACLSVCLSLCRSQQRESLRETHHCRHLPTSHLPFRLLLLQDSRPVSLLLFTTPMTLPSMYLLPPAVSRPSLCPRTAPLILATSPLFRLPLPQSTNIALYLVMSDTVPSDNRRTQKCLTLTDRLPGHLTYYCTAVLRVFSRLVDTVETT